MDILPITSLSPDAPPPADKSIRAIVTLSWPYSSSTRQCALLLADPDFRLRNRQGQVRVRFTGPSAEAVANSRVGIGDEVVLALDGASWEQDPEATRTPGRSVAGELLFKRKVHLGVMRDGGNIDLHVDAPPSPPHAQEDEVVLATPLPRAIRDLRWNLDGNNDTVSSYTYTSPAFMKRLRLSTEGFAASAYDPFTADASDVDKSIQEHRTALGSTVGWRYTERTPSPEKDYFEHDVTGTGETNPAQHSVSVPEGTLQDRLPFERRIAQMSPSPEHALISLDQHEDFAGAQSQPSTTNIPGPSSPHSADVLLVPRKQATAYTSHQPQVPDPSSDHQQQRQSQPEAQTGNKDEPSELLDQDVMQDAAQVNDPTAVAWEAKLGLPNASVPVEGSDRSGQPSTPLPDYGQPLPASADGTSAPGSLHATPQSEREKIMAQTYRSLFGFKAPEAVTQLPMRDESKSPIPAMTFSDRNPSPVPRLPLEAINQVLTSDEDRNEEAEEERSPSTQPAAFSIPQRHVPEPEIQDSPVNPVSDGSADKTEQSAAEDHALQQMAAEGAQPLVGDSSLHHSDIEANLSGVGGYELPSLRTDADISPHLGQIVSPSLSPFRLENSQLMFGTVEQPSSPQMQSPIASTISSTPSLSIEHYLEETIPTGEPQDLIHERVLAQGEEVSNAVSSRGSFPTPVIDLASPSPIESPELSPEVAETQIYDESQGHVIGEGETTELATAMLPGELQDKTLELEALSQLSPSDYLHAVSEDRDARLSHSATFDVAYPSLPLSPSNSQSIADMVSRTAMTGINDPGVSAMNFPLTPQPTQLESSTHLDVVPHGKSPPLTQEVDLPSIAEHGPVEDLYQPTPKKTPARKSLVARISNVPDVISDWFSPKRSSGIVDSSAGQTQLDVDEDGSLETPTVTHAPAPSTIGGQQRIHGLSTSFSYFTPLAKLEESLNPSSQQTPGNNVVDVFAVVTDRTGEAVRAKGGPRDYYTVLKLSDASLAAQKSVRVEIYRPWKATLPVAAEGDIILLRAFTVKSRKRVPYLLSADASAWCVWRHGDGPSADGINEKPIWARKNSSLSGGVKEEVKGPPVELGDEERRHAEWLREWWLTLQGERHEPYEHGDASAGLGGQPMAAKF